MAKESKANPGLIINETIAIGFLALDKEGGAESVKRVFFALLGYAYPNIKAPPQEFRGNEGFFFSQICMDRDARVEKYEAKIAQASEAGKAGKGTPRNQGNQNARKAPSPPPPQISPREDLDSEENRSYIAFLSGTETAEQKARREANFSQLESEFDKIAREKQEQAQKRASSDELPSSDESSEEDAGEEIREPQTPKEKQLESDAQTIKKEIARAWKISSSNLSLSWQDLEKLPQLQNIKGSTMRELLRRCSLEKQARAAREFIAEQGSIELGEFFEDVLGAMARSGWRG